MMVCRIRSGFFRSRGCSAFPPASEDDLASPLYGRGVTAFKEVVKQGVYLFFGVTDGTFQADGMTDDIFVKSDISHLNRILVGSLDPVPHVTKGRIELGGRQIGVLYVAKHESAPVIAIKNIGQDLKEGGIYFRYRGNTTDQSG
jgi:hypothetical protein